MEAKKQPENVKPEQFALVIFPEQDAKGNKTYRVSFKNKNVPSEVILTVLGELADFLKEDYHNAFRKGFSRLKPDDGTKK